MHIFSHSNNEQVAAGVSVDSCQTLHIEEGCLRNNSYFLAFHDAFWSNGSAGYAPEYFVTEYAAADAAEDIAESFAVFVLNPKPVGDTVREQKVRFFYQYPELTEIRNEMRNGLVRFVRARQR